MTLKKKTQIASITFLIIAIPFSIMNTSWDNNFSVLAFIGLICGTLGSLLSIFIPSNYVHKFENSDWILQNNLYVLTIPFKKHGISKSPQIDLMIRDGNSYNKVMNSPNCDANGNITITVHRPYIGKVIIS